MVFALLLLGLQNILGLAVQPPKQMLEIKETGALVAIVSLRAETEVVVLERDLDVCRAGLRVMYGVRGIFGAEEITRLPALGAKDLLAESGFVTGPFRVVGVGSQLALAMESFAISTL